MSESKQKYPEPTVGGLILHKSGEILLVKSFKWKDYWTVPGGHIEIGETAENAIKREIKEEVGLDIDSASLLLIQEAIYPKNFNAHKHFIFLDYLCLSKSKDVELDNREIQEYIWMTPEKALKSNLEEFTRNLINRFLSEQK
jgi:nucleoside triphosphatase|tara:strand:+ start:176 stop:601 length:426 start_codon:yes stop_codon:yes gene_type:complete